MDERTARFSRIALRLIGGVRALRDECRCVGLTGALLVVMMGGVVSIADGQVSYEVVHAFVAPARYPSAMVPGSDGAFYGTTALGGVDDGGTAFRLLLSQDGTATLTRLHVFSWSEGIRASGLTLGSDGDFYGTTQEGGPNFSGTVFRMDPRGTLTTLHSFNGSDEGYTPSAGVIQGADGAFYGTTFQGGPADGGTVYRVDAAGAFVTLHAFAAGEQGGFSGVVQGRDGNLYGTTISGGDEGYGSVFRLDKNGASFTMLHSFDYSHGAYPRYRLVQGRDGALYGTTLQGGTFDWGTVFKIDSAGTFTLLHSFDGRDGTYPQAPLVQGSDGAVYGTTPGGGAWGYGTAFKIDASGTLTLLHEFDGSEGVVPSSLIQGDDGGLYGTMQIGGAADGGTAFRLDATDASSTVIFAFGADPFFPVGTLTEASDGKIYGATAGGGASGRGVVFTVDASGTANTLHSLTRTEATPVSGLLQGSDGNLYGTTQAGGACDVGTAFKMDVTGALTTLHEFCWSDGTYPSDLILARDGAFYGTTQGGGTPGVGTIFRMDATGSVTTLHEFNWIDGAIPWAALVEGSDGSLYGTTQYDDVSGAGNWGAGTVFKLDPAGTFTTLHRFSGSDGATPMVALMQARDGKFYGTTPFGGDLQGCDGWGCGTVFRIDASGEGFATLHLFDGSDGRTAFSLIQGRDGNFYGTTEGGGIGGGTVFRMDAVGTLTTLHSFTGSDGDGAAPRARLLQASDGRLYGSTPYYGAEGGGVLFRLTLTYPFTGFFPPVNNLPTLNTVKAGKAIPVKFSLGGNHGLDVMAPGYPKSAVTACESTAQTDPIEETVTAGSSRLNYDALTGQYIYVWTTPASWAGTCRQLVVGLNDGTYHRANFAFTK